MKASGDNTDVLYRCTAKNCRHEDRGVLEALSRTGCLICGCKRLEIKHPKKGHLVVDWRSQKSLRKKGPGARRSGLRGAA